MSTDKRANRGGHSWLTAYPPGLKVEDNGRNPTTSIVFTGGSDDTEAGKDGLTEAGAVTLSLLSRVFHFSLIFLCLYFASPSLTVTNGIPRGKAPEIKQ